MQTSLSAPSYLHQYREHGFSVIEKFFSDAEIRYHFSNITIKMKNIREKLGWHRDYPNKYISTEKPDFIRVMITLDGMDESNGGTVYIPNSHRYSNDRASDALKSLKKNPNSPEAKVICCPHGSLVLLSPMLIHSGGISKLSVPRRNIIIQYGKSNSQLTTQNFEFLTNTLIN